MNSFINPILYYGKYNFLLQLKLKQLKSYDNKTEEELNELKMKVGLDFIKYSKDNSSFYKEWYKNVSFNEKSFSEVYSSLPVLNKRDFKEQESRLLTTNPIFLKKAYTSGTTGTPILVYRSLNSIISENAYIWYFRMQNGLNIGEPIVSLRGLLDRKKLSYYDKSENVLYLSSFLITKKYIKQYQELISEFKPKAIWGLPTSIYFLADLLSNSNTKIRIPLIFTSSETLYEFEKKTIEEVFSSKVFDWYGNAERTVAIGQCRYGTYHEMPLYSINDYTNKGTITTGLINKAFPLIKYYVHDHITTTNERCSCGKPKRIKSIEGRMNDLIALADGTRLRCLDIALNGVANMKFTQIIQEDLNKIQVNIVPDIAYSEEDWGVLLKNLRRYIGQDVHIDVKLIDKEELIRTKAGKLRVVISKLQSILET